MKYSTLILLSSLLGSVCLQSTQVFAQQEAAQNTAEKPDLDRYGFEKVDKTVEQKRLIGKFTRDRDQLDKAIDNTKALIYQSQGKQYLPELYLRLAELYIEKSRVAYFLRRTESGAAVKSALESLESNTLKSQAIETYKRIINQYPHYSDRDKVHFYLAHEFRELNRLEEMKQEYLTLIKEHPKSDFVAESHLLLADYYSGLKNLTGAKKHYQEVLKYPGSSAITLAQYKLAWVHISKKDFATAIKLLEKSVAGPNADKEVDIDTYGRVDIRTEAFNDMAFIYSNHYKKATPVQALKYFKGFAWSRPAYIGVLEKLAYRYIVKKKWSHGASIYRELSRIQHDPAKLLEYADYIYTASKELKYYDNAFDDVRVVVAALRRTKYSVYVEDEVKQKAIKDYEIYVRDVITQLHVKAKKDKKVEYFSQSADAYELYLNFFEESDFNVEMRLNLAESLFNAKRFTQAGKVYEELAKHSDKADKKQEFLYSATLSFYEALKDRKGLNYYQTVQAQSGLAQTGEQFASSFPNSDKVPNVLFNVAWIRYDEGKFEESIGEFTRFVEKYPTGKEAKAAVKLIVDAYSIMEDYEGLIAFNKVVEKIPKLDGAIKQGVNELASTAEAKMVSNLTVASIEDWETGKDDLLAFAKKHKSSAMGAQALNALFISSKEKNDLETMQVTGQNIIASYPDSKEAEQVLNGMIEASIRTSQFRVLAANLEQYSKQFKGTDNAKEFLMQAAQIRQSLNQPGIANGLYQSLMSQYKWSAGTYRDMAVSMAANELLRGNQRGAIQALEGQRKNVSGGFRVDLDSRIASLYWDLGESDKANKYFRLALKGFQQGAGKDIPEVRDNIAKLVYASAGSQMQLFKNTRLKGVIDNDIVASKTELFESLQEGYYSVLDFESAKWSLLALYRLYEVNEEYAQFLQNAPLPEMSLEESEQYKDIIGQKVAEYRAEGQEFISSGEQLSKRIKALDPTLSDYQTSLSAMDSTVQLYAPSKQGKEISIDAYKDDELRDLHNRMSRDPKDMASLIALSKAYLQRNDLGQAGVIAQSIIDGETARGSVLADAFTIRGLTAIAAGKDSLAREMFNKAIEEEPQHNAANTNLASLLSHYGFHKEAKVRLRQVSATSELSVLVHPKANTKVLANN
ncbi:MAG: tetratricopeptide repeat protein [Bermanella sp.]